MSFERIRLAANRGFWPAAAAAVADFAGRHGSSARQFQSVTWLVANGEHVQLARAALRAQIGNVAFIPPRIAPLQAWLGQPLSAGMAARAELYSALQSNAWVRSAFGSQPAALWALARDVAHLADELSWAAAGDADAFAGRLNASLGRHYRRRSMRSLEPQAQLVLELWRARQRAEDGAAAALRSLAARASELRDPLVYVEGGSEIAAWELAFLQRAAENAPVLAIVPDVAPVLADRPLLAAAWPELAARDHQVPIAARADAIREAELARPLTLLEAGSLEAEAMAAAAQVLDWLSAGVQSIALVALDRATARRVRALLERAQVGVRDETGWKLSTTSAAAAVMRWIDLAAEDLYWRDLLDWIKSTFTLAGSADKPRVIEVLERAIRYGGALHGVRAMRRALADRAPRVDDEATRAAHDVLTLLDRQAQLARRPRALADHAHSLARALDALGMRAALADDAVGSVVLEQLDALASELTGVGGRASLAEFRALLAARFEEVPYGGRPIDSPVVMVSLAGTRLRPFDAALLIGADAQHLPGATSELLFLSEAVRSDLGLPTAGAAVAEQVTALAALVAATPKVVATWRSRIDDEPNGLSAWLERLQFVTRRVMDDDLREHLPRAEFAVTAAASTRPAPRAPQFVPARLTASQAQSLVQCAYQYYARKLLGLAELDDVLEHPDKRDFGEALHEVLRRFHRNWGGVDFAAHPAEVLAADLAQHAHAVFADAIERAPGMLAFERRFVALIDAYIEWLQKHCGSGWRWTAGEAPHAVALSLRGGRTVELAGRVDRVDRDAGGRTRVIDYKARAAEGLRKGLKEAGEDIQLPFYGLLLERRVDSAAYLAFERDRHGAPAVNEVVPPGAFGSQIDAVALRLQDDLQRIADGAPMPALGASFVCAYCEMRGLCRRDYWEDAAVLAAEGADGG